MSSQLAELAFEDLKELITSDNPEQRKKVINELLVRYDKEIQKHAQQVFYEQLRPEMDTVDLTQAVILKVSEKLRDGKIYLQTEKEFIALLKQMTERLMIDKARAKRPHQSLDAPQIDRGELDVRAPDPTASHQMRERERQETLRKLAEQIRKHLQADEWYLFRRRYFEDASTAQIAAEVGKSEAAVRMQMKRLRDEMVAWFNGCEHLLDEEV